MSRITSAATARNYAQSIATLAVDMQTDIESGAWPDVAEALDDIAADLAKLQEYVNAKLRAIDEAY